MENPPEDWFRLLASWSKELLSATDRIHHLIGNRHQPTKGSYREVLLRRLLRRVLPERYRVSTGFIYRWNDPPTRQLDVLIWDCLEHSALLEEGELAILTAESVAAIIEVKSTLTTPELRDALNLLHPDWLTYWRHSPESSFTGIPQQVPKVPVRAVFALDGQTADVDAMSVLVFSELASFYRERFGPDAERAFEHRDQVCTNLIDAICIANGPEIEQSFVSIVDTDGHHHSVSGFISCIGEPSLGPMAVGRFCMYLLWRLAGWKSAEAAKMTLRDPGTIAAPGVCTFGKTLGEAKEIRIWAAAVGPEKLWIPDPPLWEEQPSIPA